MPRTSVTAATIEADRAYRRKWYAKNRTHAKARVTERRGQLKAWFRAHRSTLKCSRCPEDDPVCLDFHHVDPSKKDLEVTAALHHGWAIERIRAEIEKCVVLCSNCHRKLHAHEKATDLAA